MKKRILCIALAILFVASAIFFAIYNKYGNTYNYLDNDMSKYVGKEWTKEFIKGLYDGSVEYKVATEEDIQHYIAAAVAAKNSSLTKATSGEFGLYDTLLTNYYMTTVIDGEVVIISLPSKLAPTATTGMQLGADTDFARMIASLLGKSIADNSFNYKTAGKVYDGDILYIDYSVTVNGSVEKQGTYEKIDSDVADYLDGIFEGLTAEFEAKKDTVTIGTEIKFEFPKEEVKDQVETQAETDGETETGSETVTQPKTTVAITVKFVTRNEVKGAGKVVSGDRVFFDYFEGNAEKATSTNGIVDGMKDVASGEKDENGKDIIVSVNAFDNDFGAGFTEALKGLTIGTEGTITTGTGESARTFKVTIKEALPVDRTATDREGFVMAEKFFELEYTYDDESKAQTEVEVTVNGEKKKMDLAGKTVTLHVAVTSFYNMTYDYKGLVEVLGYKPGTTEKVDLYLSAHAAVLAAEKALEDGEKKTGDAKLSAEEIKKLEDAVTEAKKKETEAKTAYEKELGEGKTTTPDEAAVAAYYEYATEGTQDKLDAEFCYDVAEIVWNGLVKNAGEFEVSSKAVDVAYQGLIDKLKTTYYGSKDKEPYSKYSTFNSYLTDFLYKDKDYKAELTAEATSIVRTNTILFRLVEIYEIELTSNQQLMVSIYQQLGSELTAESYAYAAYFDNVMMEICESIEERLIDAEEENHDGHEHE